MHAASGATRDFPEGRSIDRLSDQYCRSDPAPAGPPAAIWILHVTRWGVGRPPCLKTLPPARQVRRKDLSSLTTGTTAQPEGGAGIVRCSRMAARG